MADVSAARLRQSFKGALLTPADAGYDAARRIWNGMIDRRPALIARCQNVADVARVPIGSTAFPHRYDHHVVWIEAIRGDLGHDDPMIQWARECWKAMGPYADASVYVNAVCDEIAGGTRKAGDAYGANYERLRDLKGKFDPDNVFRNNTNIEPRV